MKKFSIFIFYRNFTDVFWILHSIVLSFRVNGNVHKLQDNDLEEIYQYIFLFCFVLYFILFYFWVCIWLYANKKGPVS